MTHFLLLINNNWILAGTNVKGDILVDNRKVGPFMHRLSGFVHQDDLFDGTLTVLEHMTFIASIHKNRFKEN